MHQFESGDLRFSIQTSSRRKTLGITVDRDGSLLLHTPLPINIPAIEAFIDEKRLWIYTKLSEKKYLTEQAYPPRQFTNGEGFCYLVPERKSHFFKKSSSHPGKSYLKIFSVVEKATHFLDYHPLIGIMPTNHKFQAHLPCGQSCGYYRKSVRQLVFVVLPKAATAPCRA